MKKRVKKLFRFALLGLHGACSVAALAAELKPRFGWEPTFTNAEILAVDFDIRDNRGRTRHWKIALPVNRKYVDKLNDEIMKRCKGCKSTPAENKYGSKSWKITHPNRITYKITPDPSVVEIIVPGMNREKFEASRKTFENVLFESVKAVGLRPHGIEGQGHISLFMSVFRAKGIDGPRLFRNFVVDIANHPELALGLFEYNPLDAPALASSPGKLKDFKNTIKEYDKLPASKRTIDKLIYMIGSQVYKPSYTSKPYSPRHDQALRLYSGVGTANSSRIELRFFRPQKSFEEFLLQIKLIEGRLRFLSSQPGLISVTAKGVPSAEEAQRSFKKYVEESGQEWKNFSEYVPAEWEKKANKQKPCTHALVVLTQQDLVFRD